MTLFLCLPLFYHFVSVCLSVYHTHTRARVRYTTNEYYKSRMRRLKNKIIFNSRNKLRNGFIRQSVYEKESIYITRQKEWSVSLWTGVRLLGRMWTVVRLPVWFGNEDKCGCQLLDSYFFPVAVIKIYDHTIKFGFEKLYIYSGVPDTHVIPIVKRILYYF